MISVASKDIKKGEEISDCYGKFQLDKWDIIYLVNFVGLPWYSKNKKERTFITRKFYKFQCRCRPCQEVTNNWSYHLGKLTSKYPYIYQDWVTSDLLARTRLAELSKVRCICGEIVNKDAAGDFICPKCNKNNPHSDLDLDLVQSRVQSVGEKLYTSLDWHQGVKDLRDLYSQISNLCPPTLEHFHLHIAVWRSIWMLVGNKKKCSSGLGWWNSTCSMS